MKKIVLSMLFAISTAVHAWQPTKTVEVTVPFPPGSGNDIVARAMTDAVANKTGIKFTVVNRSGAGGTVASAYFSRLPNDGHYLNVISVGGIAAMDYTFPAFHVAMPPYTVDTFEFVTSLGYAPIVIIANKNDTVSTAKQLSELLLTESKIIVADSGGAGRLGLESILVNLDVRKKNPKLIRVEHKGPVESVNDVIGGHVRFAAVPLVVALPQLKAGNLKVVATTQQDDIKEFNITGFRNINSNINAGLMWGIAMPKGTTLAAQEFWAKVFNEAKTDPKITEFFAQNQFSQEFSYATPGKFSAHVKNQYKNYSPIVRYIVTSQQ